MFYNTEGGISLHYPMLIISTLTYKNAAAGQDRFTAVRRLFFD